MNETRREGGISLGDIIINTPRRAIIIDARYLVFIAHSARRASHRCAGARIENTNKIVYIIFTASHCCTLYVCTCVCVCTPVCDQPRLSPIIRYTRGEIGSRGNYNNCCAPALINLMKILIAAAAAAAANTVSADITDRVSFNSATPLLRRYSRALRSITLLKPQLSRRYFASRIPHARFVYERAVEKLSHAPFPPRRGLSFARFSSELNGAGLTPSKKRIMRSFARSTNSSLPLRAHPPRCKKSQGSKETRDSAASVPGSAKISSTRARVYFFGTAFYTIVNGRRRVAVVAARREWTGTLGRL